MALITEDVCQLLLRLVPSGARTRHAVATAHLSAALNPEALRVVAVHRESPLLLLPNASDVF